jgi:CRP-like cAMP-binding protein
VNTPPLEDVLDSTPLYAGIAGGVRARIIKAARRLELPRGAAVYQPGDTASGAYTVIAGRVKLALPTAAGGKKVIELLGPGATFAHSTTFLDEPHVAYAETLSRAVLMHVPREVLVYAVRRNPLFAERLLMQLSTRLRRLINQLASSTLHSATQRTIAFLLDQVPSTASDCVTITLPHRKRLIASQLNLTPEHFSRVLRDLAGAGLIRVDRAQITIADLEALRSHRRSRSA